MKLAIAPIFDLDHRLNKHMAEVNQTLTRHLGVAHRGLQAQRPDHARMQRVGQAMARNALFGMTLSFKLPMFGLGLPLPRVLAPLNAMHLPNGFGRRFGLMGVVAAAQLAVGTYGRLEGAVASQTKGAGFTMARDHFDTGLTGNLVSQLLALAPSSQHQAGKMLAGGCRVGALLVCIAGTLVRTGLHVVGIILGASLSMVVAPTLGVAAGLYQAVASPNAIVDIKTWADENVAQLIFV